MHADVKKPFNAGWIAPTPTELIAFKKYTAWSTNELSRVANIKSKHMRNYFKEKSYIKGQRVQYTTWRFWLESFGMVEPVKLEPLKPFLESRIFSHEMAEWKKPTTLEFRALARRSGNHHSILSDILNMQAPLIENLLNSDKAAQNSTFQVKHGDWLSFLQHIRIRSLKEYREPPKLPEACLQSMDNDFKAPNPKIIRQFIAWTGRSAGELASIFGVDEARLKFFSTNRSFRSTDAASIKNKVFSPDNWAAPNFIELRTFMTICSLDPFETGQQLKLSTKEMRVALAMPDNTQEKKQALPIKQEDWFKLLDFIV